MQKLDDDEVKSIRSNADIKTTPKTPPPRELEEAILNKMEEARSRLLDMANRLPETAMAH